jgi:hypothetical protein
MTIRIQNMNSAIPKCHHHIPDCGFPTLRLTTLAPLRTAQGGAFPACRALASIGLRANGWALAGSFIVVPHEGGELAQVPVPAGRTAAHLNDTRRYRLHSLDTSVLDRRRGLLAIPKAAPRFQRVFSASHSPQRYVGARFLAQLREGQQAKRGHIVLAVFPYLVSFSVCEFAGVLFALLDSPINGRALLYAAKILTCHAARNDSDVRPLAAAAFDLQSNALSLQFVAVRFHDPSSIVCFNYQPSPVYFVLINGPRLLPHPLHFCLVIGRPVPH